MLPAPTTMSPRQQRLLDGNAASLQRGVEMVAVEGRIEWFDAQARQQLCRRSARQVGRPDHRAESPGVGQAQAAMRGHQVEMIVRTGRTELLGKGERARHAEVHEQPAPVDRQPQPLAAPLRKTHGLFEQRSSSHPSGHLNGLPSRTPTMRAPAMRSAKLCRVISTSGSSGIRELSGSGPLPRVAQAIADPSGASPTRVCGCRQSPDAQPVVCVPGRPVGGCPTRMKRARGAVDACIPAARSSTVALRASLAASH